MKPKSTSILLCILFACTTIYPQSYEDDTLAVRAILDSNGFYSLAVEYVTDSSNGRIDTLSLIGPGKGSTIPEELARLLPEIGKLTNLRNLHLSRNKLTSVPNEIGSLTNLEEISLSDNNLASLPPEIWSLTNLESLFLGPNELTVVPSEIVNLTKLTKLVVGGNNLTGIPSEIWNLTNLEYLHINGSKLDSLSPDIENLTSLEILSLGDNNLTKLPVEIASLTNLKDLVIFRNNLTSLLPEIGRLTNLISISFTGNNLVSLPDSIVMFAPANYCDFGHNNLHEDSLSDTVIFWLDKYDPDWRETQGVTEKQNSSQKKAGKFTLNIQNSSIVFNLPSSGNVTLQMHDMKGRLINTLISSFKEAGTYTLTCDIKRYSAGVYYIRLSLGNNSLTQKVVIMK